MGADAHIGVENYLTPTIERSYHEGSHWKGHLASQYFLNEAATKRAIVADCHVVLFDGILSDFESMGAVLEIVAQAEPRRVAVVARSIRDKALGMLVSAQQSHKFEIIGAEIGEVGQAGTDDLIDLAALTGAKLFSREAGYPLTTITAQDMGRAHRVEADHRSLVVVGRPGRPQSVRERINVLQTRRSRLQEQNIVEKPDLLGLRIARLSGCAGTLKVGAASDAEREVLRQKADKCIRVLPLALRCGILPGGGVAYLNCISRLGQLDAQGEEAWGIGIVARALESLFRRIVVNSGSDAPAAALRAAQLCGENFGFDALSGQVVDMTAAGIWDSADVLIAAFRTAVSGAMMALTIDAVVLSSHPKTSTEP